jgi:hypothetical protein
MRWVKRDDGFQSNACLFPSEFFCFGTSQALYRNTVMGMDGLGVSMDYHGAWPGVRKKNHTSKVRTYAIKD